MSPSSEFMRTHRPWPVKALNRAGLLLERTGLLKLRRDEDHLLKTACRQTGLSDFGDENFRQPLRRLLEALDRESRLNLIGKLAAQQDTLQILKNRLTLQHDREKYPGISRQRITKPLFIIGLPRTGTTLLHSLLALDADYRAPLTWEVMFPSPPTPEGEKDRVARCASNFAWLNRLAPNFKAMHLAGAELPQECIAILSHTFMSDQFDIMYNVPSYRAWLESQDMQPAYDYHRQFLQHLQFRCPARHWVLKAPAHMLSLGALFNTYPDAQVVQTHREPLEVLASTASLGTVLRGTFSDFVDPVVMGREMSRFWADTLDTFMRLRENHPPEQFFDLQYPEIVRDPIGAVRRLYLHFGNELTADAERRMREFMAAHPKDKHGPHRYTMAQFGLDPREESPRFDHYRKRFDLANPQPLAVA